MTTADKLLEIKKMANAIEEFDNDNEAIVQLITADGKFYPLINGNYTAIQAIIESAYRLFPDFKDIVDEVVSGTSVIKELQTNHLG
ncbi:hypothetical protein [Limibacterium fermenti]|uniref:hypothetical protein n=1 Tax=Limibacterium fermenti TaxID=3229863 RepID=UPI000E84B997|nr:hypothetical protein [Porphyromonadaceae bacterium]